MTYYQSYSDGSKTMNGSPNKAAIFQITPRNPIWRRISSVEFMQHFIFRTHPEREFIAHLKGVKKDRKKIGNFLKNSLSYCESIL